ncbi:TLC domain-containing protein [Apodospora peruviana]|uniref:TLC domain-containing protein n=1 Tax=Apodospora peruviana TaxID=516989 RepID=A0AAE0IU23_9PEZI|nr:TLC domain-containing protein [Apodospora peruviana]
MGNDPLAPVPAPVPNDGAAVVTAITPTTSSPRTAKPLSSGKKEIITGPVYLSGSSNVVAVRRRKRPADTPMEQLTRWFVKNQIGFSFNLLALLFLAHGMPRARAHTSKYFMLSYYNPNSGKYGIGYDDVYLVAFCVTLFTLLRASVMEYILAPFAKSQRISKAKDVTRFSEQAWLFVYYCVFWTLGVYIYCTSPYFLNLHELWTSWPSREMSGVMKAYFLAQLAFWMQQLLVINIEARRKDHWQMFTHHIATICLMYAAYRYGHTRVGNVILMLMDIGDLILPLAKCIKYLGYTTLCDYMFGLFMLSWFVARHIFYNHVCYSVWAHTPGIMTVGCFSGPDDNISGPFEPSESNGAWYLLEPLWDSEGLVCYNEKVKWTFLSMLLFLQALTIMWFTLIIRVALKVISGSGAEDTRSDDEADDLDDEEEFEYEEPQPLEEEVGVEDLDLKNWERRTGVKRQTSAATGVSLPGHSDRKELLNRIGCEKQID